MYNRSISMFSHLLLTLSKQMALGYYINMYVILMTKNRETYLLQVY